MDGLGKTLPAKQERTPGRLFRLKFPALVSDRVLSLIKPHLNIPMKWRHEVGWSSVEFSPIVPTR